MLVLFQRMFLNSSLQTRQTFRKVSNLLEIKTSHFTTASLDPPISHYVSPPEVGQSGLLRSPLFIANLSSVPKSQKNKKKPFSRTKCHTYGPRSSRDELILCFLLPRNRTPKWPASYLWSGIIYSRSVLKSSSSHSTYGCTLLGENLFSSATCARRHVFFLSLTLFCSSSGCQTNGND